MGYALFWKGNFYWKHRYQRFISASLWFAAVQALHVNWLTSTRYIGPLILLGYAFILMLKGVQFGCLSLLVASSRRILGIAGTWVLMEWFCLLFIFSGYAFDPVGLALSASPLGIQAASLCGALGLSFWVVTTNLCVLRGQKFWAVLALLFPFAYGAGQLLTHSPKLEEKSEVLLVQAALPPELRYQINPNVEALSAPSQWRYMLSLLQPYMGEKIDLIVFPESAVKGSAYSPFYERDFVDQILAFHLPNVLLPWSEDEYVSNSYWVQAIANTFGARVVIGLEEDRHNVACYYEPGGEQVQMYSKQQLVPFGEYMPLRKLMEKKPFSKWITEAYSVASMEHLLFFEPGREGTVLGGDLGVSVCYEEANGGLMLKSRKKGAKMHVNISNDGWFPKSRLPVSHFLHGKLRSVEQGVPLVRACNIGVTCAVDSLGRELGKLPYEGKRTEATADALKLSVPTYTYKTLYSYTGNSLIVAISAFFALGILLQKKKQNM